MSLSIYDESWFKLLMLLPRRWATSSGIFKSDSKFSIKREGNDMRIRYLLLLVGLVLGVSGAGAFTISNSVTTSFGGTLSYSITGDGITGPFTINQADESNYAYLNVLGVNVKGVTTFTATTTADDGNGDRATSTLAAGKATGKPGYVVTQVQNLNTYAYVTPNLAWTGIYTDKIEACSINTGPATAVPGISPAAPVTGAYTRFNAPVNSQNSNLAWFTTNGAPGNGDFTAKQIYITSQAGGSYDNTQFSGRTYAMSNMEYGLFISSGPLKQWTLPQDATSKNYINDIRAGSLNPVVPMIPAVPVVEIAGGPFTFAINSPAINYADADLVYSNADLSATGSGVLSANGVAVWNGLPIIKTGSKPLPCNVFTYGYINVPQNIWKADSIFY